MEYFKGTECGGESLGVLSWNQSIQELERWRMDDGIDMADAFSDGEDGSYYDEEYESGEDMDEIDGHITVGYNEIGQLFSGPEDYEYDSMPELELNGQDSSDSEPEEVQETRTDNAARRIAEAKEQAARERERDVLNKLEQVMAEESEKEQTEWGAQYDMEFGLMATDGVDLSK